MVLDIINCSEAKRLAFSYTPYPTLHWYSYFYPKKAIDEGQVLILTVYEESSHEHNAQNNPCTE